MGWLNRLPQGEEAFDQDYGAEKGYGHFFRAPEGTRAGMIRRTRLRKRPSGRAKRRQEMRDRWIAKVAAGLMVLVVGALLLPSSAFGWGSATHTYFAKRLGNRYGVMNLQEMYGAVLPDMPNLMLGHPHQAYLWTQTHYEFMKVVDEAGFGRRKAFAYGFASHNEAWGADLTAHISAITSPGEGYVVSKMNILAPWLQPEIETFLAANGIPHTPEVVEELALRFADVSVESAVDLLVSRNEDRLVGIRMFLAAEFRSWFVPFLLWEAYGMDYVMETGTRPLLAALTILIAEKEFREYMGLYGAILAQEDAVDLMAEQGAQLAEAMLEMEYGIQVDVPSQLMKFALLAGVEVVIYDYSVELEATLNYIEEQLEAHGVETY